MDNKTSNQQFNIIIDKATLWFFNNYVKISLTGDPLTSKLTQIAYDVGVKHPEKIRVIRPSEIDFSKNYSFGNLDDSKYLPSINENRYQGISYMYGIVLQDKVRLSYRHFAELFRFIAFYEGFGSIKTFLNLYLRSVLTFGWDKNPFNADARLTSMTYH